MKRWLVVLIIIIVLAVALGVFYSTNRSSPNLIPSNCVKAGEAPQIIGPGIANSSSCCEGLFQIYSKSSFDESCTNIFEKNGGGGMPFVCAACGDNVCDSNVETKCNCPADCK